MKRYFLSIVLFLVLSSLFLVSAKAQPSCQTIYGGGDGCVSTGKMYIDKKVLDLQTNKMVDNLGINDTKFQPANAINFQINLTNTSDVEIKQISVKDIFPQFVVFNSGPGNFDVNTKTLSFEVKNLKPNETRTFTVLGKVVEASNLPMEQGVVCIVNQATASSRDDGQASDSTQFCIQKQTGALPTSAPNPTTKGGLTVLPPPPITKTPATGPEGLVLFSLLPTGIAGWFLIEYSRKKIKPLH